MKRKNCPHCNLPFWTEEGYEQHLSIVHAPGMLEALGAAMETRKLCHGCGQPRQMDARANYCATCQFHQREGMDIAFRDDNFDER